MLPIASLPFWYFWHSSPSHQGQSHHPMVWCLTQPMIWQLPLLQYKTGKIVGGYCIHSKFYYMYSNAAFRLAWRSPHWWFLYNYASATPHRGKIKRWAASSQSIDNLAGLHTAADSWLLFNLIMRAMSLGGKVKAVWPLRAATLKQQAVIRWWNCNCGRLVWNQLKTNNNFS